MDEAKLGRVVSTHPVDCRARWASGLTGVLFVVLGAIVLGSLFVFPDIMDHVGRRAVSSLGVWVIAASASAIVIGLTLAVVQLPRAVRGGLHEVFEIRSRGLVHRGRQVRGWTWQEVAGMRVQYEHPGEAGSGATTFRLTIQFTAGARMHVDRHTFNGSMIARILTARCPEVGDLPASRLARVLPPYLTAFFAVVVAVPGWYLYQAEERATADGSGVSVDEELDKSLETILIVGVAVGLVGLLISSLTWLLSRSPRRRRASGRGRRSP